ncbi:TPA: hypothetical protein N0F65_001011, partial [Lagenidium giganteum]
SDKNKRSVCGWAAAVAAVHAADPVPGGWSSAKVDDPLTKMLTTALIKDANYAASVKTRVCVTKINSLEQQVVAGMNYLFSVSGCDVKASADSGMCSDSNKCATPKEWDIKVFSGIDNKTQIASIEPKGANSGGNNKPAGSGSGVMLGAGAPGSGSKNGTKPADGAHNPTRVEVMMTMTTKLMVLGAAALLTAASVTLADSPPGSWQHKDVNDEMWDVVVDALSSDAHYKAEVGAFRICVRDITSIDYQVVSGMNYKFHVRGCEVQNTDHAGRCRGDDANCAPESFVVAVYEQSWTQTLEVSEISRETTALAATTSAYATSGEVSDEEKALIDAWIVKAHRNKYGDDPDMYYTGGTPLFDESTGENIDLYTYIIEQHPDRPWQTVTAANLMATGPSTAATHSQSSFVSTVMYMGVMAVIGVAVVTFRARRGRYAYNAIDNHDT